MRLLMTILTFLFTTCFLTSETQESESKESPSPQKIVYFLPGNWGNIFDHAFLERMGVEGYNLEPMYRLHDTAAKAGYQLIVADPDHNKLRDYTKKEIEFSDDFQSLIVFEYPPDYLSQYPNDKLALVMWEPPLINPSAYENKKHEAYSRVYTWRDDLVDHQKYYKIYYPALRPMIDNPLDFDSKYLCALIASNKHAYGPNELYTERQKTILFFEINHPAEFALYGRGWASSLKTYKGSVLKKVDTLKNYKFSIVYENCKEVPGYITEKIFNSFEAGCVPIYWGAPNITSYIPKECFIARENFKTNVELYEFMKNMKKEQYLEYIKNIQTYLGSEKAQLYSSENFVKIMMDYISRPPSTH